MEALQTSEQTLFVEKAVPTYRKIFFGSRGLRAGWRLLIFFAVLVPFEAAIRTTLKRIPFVYALLKSGQNGVLTPQYEYVFLLATIAGLFAAASVMARIEGRKLGDYGIPIRAAFGSLFWQGVLWGLALESVEILAIYVLHGYSFGGLALSGVTLVKYAVEWAIAFVLVGIFEEFAFRGYTLFTLTEGIGFWPAAIVMSLLFGAAHIGNPRENWIGAVSVVIFGIFACLTIRRTGSLWFAIGLHAGVDYAETFVFSVPDSGMLSVGHLLNSSFHGPRWLTGGEVGPEASVLDFIVCAAALLLFTKLYPAKEEGVKM
jgi:membrane protease YdiL (CAAX protease family)